MTNWRNYAACLGLDDFMFPGSRDGHGIRAAKEVCDQCPVRRICLRAAMAEESGRSLDNRHGIRGGLSASQRYGLYKRTAQQCAGVAA
ncbi:WhiB family transcriptional regulator [Streptomyces sp. NBC_00237]|uniref:WhiB family transcriptional regulator n=1 Tax=Streptomyces sp. NBC_00237 TaxID=2975687 RepID=UPI002259E72F|nr:WhiB family transcriptional regulator [Streptomyces sp. NBC_00237]MCX5201083.1 WhiB family transcriptional regulator [Streptomyces sp. NBC_00237]